MDICSRCGTSIIGMGNIGGRCHNTAACKRRQALDQVINAILGIDRKGSIETNTCVFCKEPLTNFRNAVSEREAAISGMCQKCQDKTFGYDEPDPIFEQPERQFYTPTANDFIIERQPMICASAEAESRKYHKYIGKSGRIWLAADQEDAAANVYVEGGPNSDGFAGRTLTFQLTDSSEIKLKGPWHTNSQALFEDTGVDVRDKYYTYIVISKDRKYGEHYESIMVDVLYRDEAPQLGSFHRGDVLAREWAREIGVPVYCYSQSKGGSSCGQVKPDAVFYWEKDNKASLASAAQDAIIRT